MAIPSNRIGSTPPQRTVSETPLHLFVVQNMAIPPHLVGSDWFKSQINQVHHNETPLTMAIRLKRVERIKELLEKGADPLLADNNGNTPLTAAEIANNPVITALIKGALATKSEKEGEPSPNKRFKSSLLTYASTGNLEGVKKCIEEEKEDIDTVNEQGSTALLFASEKGHVNVIEYLLDRGAKLGSGMRTPIALAVRQGKLDAVKILVEKGAFVLQKNITSSDWTLLHVAALGGHKEMIEFLIEKGAAVNARSKDRKTALYIAVTNQKLEAADTLIKKGASVDAKDPITGWTDLHVAAKENSTDVIEFWIQKQIDVNVESKDGTTPLFLAAESGKLEAVKKLKEANASLTGPNGLLGFTPLSIATMKGHIPIIEYLADQGIDLNEPDKQGATALYHALQTNRRDALQKLLAKGADVDAKNGTDQWTPLHWAVYWSRSAIAEDLISHQANINAKTKDSKTPLFIAAGQGRLDMVKLLIKHKALIDERNDEGEWTALHAAAQGGHGAVIDELIRNGADPNAMSGEKISPLYQAVMNGKREAAQQLIFHGARSDEQNGSTGWTVLGFAAHKDDVEMIQTLIQSRATVDGLSKDSATPLAIAAFKGNWKAVAELIQAGAKIEQENGQYGRRAMHAAALANHVEVVKVLIQAKAEINPKSRDNKTPLYLAAENGQIESVKELILNGVPVDQRNGKDELTPLHIASEFNQEEVVQLLIDKGATIDPLSKDGETPLYLATKQDSPESVKVLIKNKAAINQTNTSEKRTALFLAAMNEELEMMQYLIDQKADVNLPDKEGITPLFVVAGAGYVNGVMALLNTDTIDVNQRCGPHQQTALGIAALQGHKKIVKKLLGKGADISSKDAEGKTAEDLAQTDAIKSLFTALREIPQHIGKLKLFHQKLSQAGPWNLDEFFQLVQEHRAHWKNQKLLVKSDLQALTEASLKKMLPLLGMILSKETTLGNTLTTHIRETIEKIAKGTDLKVATQLHHDLRGFLSLLTQLTSFIYAPPLANEYIKQVQKYKDHLQGSLIQRKEEHAKTRSKEGLIDTQTEDEFLNANAEEDVFRILAQFEVGVGFYVEKIAILPMESYVNRLGVQPTTFHQYGLFEGRDFQAIGVDCLLDYYHTQLSLNPKNMEMRNLIKNILQSKLDLIEAIGIKESSPSLVSSLSSLQNELVDEATDPQTLPDPVMACHKELSLALLKAFFSQSAPQLRGKALHELKKETDAPFSPSELYHLPQPKNSPVVL